MALNCSFVSLRHSFEWKSLHSNLALNQEVLHVLWNVSLCVWSTPKINKVANPDSYETHGSLILLSAWNIAGRYSRKQYPSTLIITRGLISWCGFLNTYLKLCFVCRNFCYFISVQLIVWLFLLVLWGFFEAIYELFDEISP